MDFNYILSNQIILGVEPNKNNIKNILSTGVTLILDFRGNPKSYKQLLPKSVYHVNLPIFSFNRENDEYILSILSFITECIDQGHIIYFHSYDNDRRPDLILTCYIGKLYFLDIVESLEQMYAWVSIRAFQDYFIPNSGNKVNFLLRFLGLKEGNSIEHILQWIKKVPY